MEKNKFYEEVIAAVRQALPEDIRRQMEIKLQEVIKNNDVKLHGLTIGMEGDKVMPTIYLEECFEAFQNGEPMKEIAEGIVTSYANSLKEAPKVNDVSMAYEDIQDKLIVQVVEAERNKDRLRNVVYKPIENGLAMMAYVVIKDNEDGSMRYAVTKDMAQSNGYDIDKLLGKALDNTMEKYEPVFSDMNSMLFGIKDAQTDKNPLSDGFEISHNEEMFLLTNRTCTFGATALFYPEVQKRIGDALGKNYYVLPSSLHEVIILPESTGHDVQSLRDMVKDANSTVVDEKDILSDRVFMYDRTKEKLIEPTEKERSGAERSER